MRIGASNSFQKLFLHFAAWKMPAFVSPWSHQIGQVDLLKLDFHDNVNLTKCVSTPPRFNRRSLARKMTPRAKFPFHMKHWRLCFMVALILSCRCEPVAAQTPAISTHPADAKALLDLLTSLTSQSDWPSIAPDPCVSGPQGIMCEPDETSDGVLRVTSLQFGSKFDLVPCSSAASLPSSISNLTALTSLSFLACFTQQPTLLPSSLPASLRLLTFTSNPALSGSIPPALGELSSLERLVLSQNNLTGSIPTELGSLHSLVQLDLSHNELTGVIPESLGSIEGLVNLDLRWNQLQGGLPFSFSRGLNQLQRLALSNNKMDSINLNFTSSEPGGGASVVGLQKLTLFDLSWNELRGELPSSLGELLSLQDLFLNSNSELQGNIPSALGKLTGLVRLDLSNCGLEGPISEDLVSGWRNLRFFSVRGNELSGKIPASLGLLPVIFTLNLDGNQFTGAVPFSPSFVNKMGPRNLVVKPDNPGLCSALGTPPPSLLGLELCPGSDSRNVTAASGSPSPSPSRSGATRHGVSNAFILAVVNSCVVVVILGWKDHLLNSLLAANLV